MWSHQVTSLTSSETWRKRRLWRNNTHIVRLNYFNPDWLLAFGQSRSPYTITWNTLKCQSRRVWVINRTGRQAAVELTLGVVNQLVQLLERHITAHWILWRRLRWPRTIPWIISSISMRSHRSRAADGRAIRVRNFGQLQYTRAIANRTWFSALGLRGQNLLSCGASSSSLEGRASEDYLDASSE